jgi:RNA-binding protein
MALPELTGAQKARLRGLGQRIGASLKVGKDGATPAVIAELRRQLRVNELVKVRFLGSGRDERAGLCGTISQQTESLCVGSVGQTALFYTPRAGPAGASAQGR